MEKQNIAADLGDIRANLSSQRAAHGDEFVAAENTLFRHIRFVGEQGFLSSQTVACPVFRQHIGNRSLIC